MPCIFTVLEALLETDALVEVLAEVTVPWLVDAVGSSVGASLVCSTASTLVSSAAAALVMVAVAALIAVASPALILLNPRWLMMSLAVL
jgi:xanthine/uracil/vitamin C permease (AzgA family)